MKRVGMGEKEDRRDRGRNQKVSRMKKNSRELEVG